MSEEGFRKRSKHNNDDDDDGDDKSQPRKEMQEQLIINKSISEMMVGFLLHLILLVFCVYVQIYDNNNIKETGGKGIEGLDVFGGRWKYLTCINLLLQSIYFSLVFLHDIMPASNAKQSLSKFCDVIFTSFVFPLALFVSVTFWGIYAIDRELILPSRLDEFNPPILTHLTHTTIVVTILLEVFLVFHRYPTIWKAVAMVFGFTAGYIIWILIINAVSDYWVYPFLRVMEPSQMLMFFAFCFLLALAMYFIGKFLGQWRWQERHHALNLKNLN